MKTFKPQAFAKQLAEVAPTSHSMTIQVLDSDGALVIRVLDGDQHDVAENRAEVIGEHDTGLNGNDDPAAACDLGLRLVHALKDLGIRASME